MFTRSRPASHPIRVAHYVGSLHRGGIETWLVQAAKKLDTNNFEFTALVNSENDPDVLREFASYGGKVSTIPLGGNFISSIVNLMKVLRQERYDVIHCHCHWFSGVVLFAALSFCPTRIVHARADTSRNDARSSFLRKMQLWMLRRLINNLATHRIAVSREAARSLFGRRQGARAEIFETSIDLSEFAAITSDVAIEEFRLWKSLGPVIGHVGRFTTQKNHAFLVRAMHALRSQHAKATLVLVGDGPLFQQTRELVENLQLYDTVKFLGARSDVPSLIANFDIVAFPSLSEGFGRVALEAQIVGTPLVCSDAIPSTAIVVPSLVDRAPLVSPEAFARRLLLALTSKPERSNCNLKHFVGGRFDMALNVERLQYLYQSAARNHSKRMAK